MAQRMDQHWDRPRVRTVLVEGRQGQKGLAQDLMAQQVLVLDQRVQQALAQDLEGQLDLTDLGQALKVLGPPSSVVRRRPEQAQLFSSKGGPSRNRWFPACQLSLPPPTLAVASRSPHWDKPASGTSRPVQGHHRR